MFKKGTLVKVFLIRYAFNCPTAFDELNWTCANQEHIGRVIYSNKLNTSVEFDHRIYSSSVKKPADYRTYHNAYQDGKDMQCAYLKTVCLKEYTPIPVVPSFSEVMMSVQQEQLKKDYAKLWDKYKIPEPTISQWSAVNNFDKVMAFGMAMRAEQERMYSLIGILNNKLQPIGPVEVLLCL